MHSCCEKPRKDTVEALPPGGVGIFALKNATEPAVNDPAIVVAAV